jgi:hypothetical protein
LPFRKPERNRADQAVIVVTAFLAFVLAAAVFRAANMWLPVEKIVLRGQPAVVGYVLEVGRRGANGSALISPGIDPPVLKVDCRTRLVGA